MTARPPSLDHPGFPISLGFVAGFIDLFGFLQWYGLLAAHVTGNLIFLAYDITRGNYALVMKLAVLPLFALFVAVSTGFITKVSDRDRHPIVPALALESAILGVCLLLGLLLPSPRGPDDIAAVIPGSVALLAMALQNTIMRLLLNNLPPTTVMTGNITQVVAQATRRAAGQDTAALSRRALLVAYTLAAFAVGAISGGLAQIYLGYAGLLLPIAALLALLPLCRTSGVV